MSKIPHFQDNRDTDGGKLVSLMLPDALYPQKDVLILISVSA
jgi:hypothetical protein